MIKKNNKAAGSIAGTCCLVGFITLKSVSEDLLGSEAVDGPNLLQGLHVEFLLVAKDDVAIRLVGNGLF